MADKPIKKFRAGSISATIWKNTKNIKGKDIEYNTVVINRKYKDNDDRKTTDCIRINN